MIRKHPRYKYLTIKNLPLTTVEQLIYLVDERGYTITGAVAQGLRLLYQEEQPEQNKGQADEH